MSVVESVQTLRSGYWNPEELVHVYNGMSKPTLPRQPSGHLVGTVLIWIACQD